MLVWGIHKYYYFRSLSLSDEIATSSPAANTDYPVFIDISGLPRLPIVAGGKVQGTWSIAANAANHVRTSSIPGKQGNTIIYGHNTDTIFGKLVSVPVGSEITVTTSDGIHHTYTISETHEVDTWQTELLQPSKSEILTLYTCSGWFDSKRFVVRAIPR